MQLNPYGMDGVRMALDLARRPPGTTEELTASCDRHGLVLDRTTTGADVTFVHGAIEQWLATVDAVGHEERSARVNAMTAAYCSFPTLTDHANTGWHLHYRVDDLRVGHQVAAMMAAGTALHLAGRGIHRLGRCAAADCTEVFVDLSRTGRQRYCSAGCTNRNAVRRHRARRP